MLAIKWLLGEAVDDDDKPNCRSSLLAEVVVVVVLVVCGLLLLPIGDDDDEGGERMSRLVISELDILMSTVLVRRRCEWLKTAFIDFFGIAFRLCSP